MAKDPRLEAAVKREVKAQLESIIDEPVEGRQQPHAKHGFTDAATAAAAGGGASLLFALLQPQELLQHGSLGVIVYGVLAVAMLGAGVAFGWLRSRQG